MILIYILSIIIANLTIIHIGPYSIPFVSFFMIGLDFVLRDLLNNRLTNAKMFILILFSGVITFIINRDAQDVAIASSISFTLASLCDWSIFNIELGSWEQRSIRSNMMAALVDSILFPTILFGGFIIGVTFLQVIMKILGGFFWLWVFKRFLKNSLDLKTNMC